MNQDLEHLRWLSIGFYVNAGISVIFGLFPFIHLFLGIAMVTGSFESDKNSPPPFIGWLFIGIAVFFIVTGLAMAVCNFLAGRFLKQHTKYTFCLVVGAVNCLFMPLGTILGIFTIIVLVRDSVKNLFNSYSSAQFSNPPHDAQRRQ